MARTSDTQRETKADNHRLVDYHGLAANSGGKRVDDQSDGAYLEDKQ